MNILILLPNNAPWGAEQYLKMLAKFHEKQAVTIIILRQIIPPKSDFWHNLNGSNQVIYMNKASYLLGVFKFIIYLIRNNRKIYHRIYCSHVLTSGLIGLLISFRLIKKISFIARESSSVFKRFQGSTLMKYKLVYKLGYKNIDLLLCQTPDMKHQLIRHLPYLKHRCKIVVMPNPIDMDLIDSFKNENIQTKIPENYIIAAGRLIHAKGFDLLIQSFAKLKSIPLFSNMELLILGDGSDKELLYNYSLKYGVQNEVHFLGLIRNVYPFFRQAKLCVVSSRIEGFPNVLLQMMSQNTRVISTLCAGEIDRIPGIYKVPVNNNQALTNSMSQALRNNGHNINRTLFDNYLKAREISNYMMVMDKNLHS